MTTFKFHKHITAILTCAIVTIAGICFTSCDKDSDFVDPGTSTTMQKSGGTKINKPKFADDGCIGCTYSGSRLYVRSGNLNCHGILTVRDANTGESRSYNIDSEDVVLPVGEHSEMQLELTTDSHEIYTGIIRKK